jgi:hypothetical protein
MFDPGPSLLTALVLGLGPASPPPSQLLEPTPPPGEACVLVVPSLYLGGRLEPCAAPQRPAQPPRIVPLDLLGHSASDE